MANDYNALLNVVYHCLRADVMTAAADATPLLPVFVDVAHVNDLVVELLHRPDLRRSVLAFHENRRLAHERAALQTVRGDVRHRVTST